jgi:hypothetical protein
VELLFSVEGVRAGFEDKLRSLVLAHDALAEDILSRLPFGRRDRGKVRPKRKGVQKSEVVYLHGRAAKAVGAESLVVTSADVLDHFGNPGDLGSPGPVLSPFPSAPTSVGGSRSGSRGGDRSRLESILNDGHSLCRSSSWKARWDKVSSDQATLVACMVTRVLAQQAFWDAVAHPYDLVLALTFEVVVPRIMGASALVAAGGRPLALRG